jgi:hypothetical protein
MKAIALVLLIFVAFGVANGEDCKFNVRFTNNSDQTVIYMFYWEDHPFKSFYPANMAGGELESGKSYIIERGYTCGKYYVDWFFLDDRTTAHRERFEQNVPATRLLLFNYE